MKKSAVHRDLADRGLPPPVERDDQARLTSDYARFRSSQVANVDYALCMALPAGAAQFHGVNVIGFDLTRCDAPVTVDFNGGSIAGIAINGSEVAADYNGAYLTLPLRALVKGRNMLRIAFRHDYSRDGAGLQRFADPEDGEVYLFSHFEPYDANRMFPCFDQPDLKASFSLTVLAPEAWQVISAMPEREVVPASDRAASGLPLLTAMTEPARVWTFATSPRFSTYVFALHAGPYAAWESRHGDVPLRLFSRRSVAHYVDAGEWLSLTRNGLAFFNDWFDLDYPYAKYDQLIVPGLNIGAMENVAAVTFNESFLSRGEQTRDEAEALTDVLLHELSHMWFGNLVTMEWWDGLWLKESFATYMSHLAATQISEHKSIWQTFFSRAKQSAYRADERVTTHPVDVPVGDTRDAFANFDSITYNKGASVLKQLAHFVGDQAFQAGVRRYLSRHAGQTTRLADFVEALSRSAGLDLEEWSRQWLFTAGFNTLQARVECADGVVSRLSLQQTAPQAFAELRAHRVQVALFSIASRGTVDSLATLDVKVSGKSTTVDAAVGKPCPDLLYPNAGDWGFARIALDEATVAALMRHIGAVGDPLQRSMFWQSLWDMVRSADLPMPRFLGLAQRELASEQDLHVVRLVLDRVVEGAQMAARAMPASEQLLTGPVAELETLVWSRLAEAADNSARMLWFDAWLHLVHSPAGLARLAAPVEWLNLDPRRQWSALTVLSGHGVAGVESSINAMLANDDSEFAQRRAMAARAAAPDASTKADWIARLLNPTDALTLAQAREVMRSLFPAHQTDLIDTFADRILAALPVLAATRDDAYLRAYNRLLPQLCRPSNANRLAAAIALGNRLHPESLRALRVLHQEEQICAQILKLAGVD